MKKIVKLFLIMFITVTFFSLNNVVAAEITGNFNVTSVEEENELWYGVKHSRHFAESSSQVVVGNAAGSGGGGAAVRGQLYPQQVNILEVPTSETVRIVPWTKFISNSDWKLNTVKAMATDFEVQNVGWKVLGAINGDFFDIQAKNPLPYQPSNSHASFGEFYKTTTGRSIGFRNDGSTDSLVGGVSATRSGFKLSIYDSSGQIREGFETITVNKINESPGEGEISLYYSYYTAEHAPIPIEVLPVGTTAYVIGNAENSLANSTDNFYGKGSISSVTTSAFDLTKGQFALVSNNTIIDTELLSGTTVRVQRTMTGAYEGINDFMGCGATLLKAGEPIDEDVNRHPRTMVGKKADGTIVMAVIDGRQPDANMYGAASDDMQAMMAHYGCVDAYNLDGGGSSTLIILENGEFVVKNSPSDGSERSDANCLLIAVKEPVIDHKATSITTTSISLLIDINNNGHPVEKLFIKMNEELKEVVDNQVFFDGLTSNKNYIYEFQYENPNGDLVKLINYGKIATAKKHPKFTGITFEQEGNNLKIIPLLDDPDFATTGMYVSLNGRKNFTSNGVANVVNTTYKEDDIVILYYEVVLNDGKTKKFYTYFSPQFASCQILSGINRYQMLQIAAIFK